MANIKVAVRIRPISEREISITGADIVVHTDGNEISLTNLKVSASKAGDSRKRTRRYGFDYCFNSSSLELEAHATQEKVYEKLGRSALDALFSGFNACLVAYGQSASGKTYTMMGPKNDPGLTPRLCEGLFLRIFEEEKKGDYYETAVSYLEIYNERVRDLLKPSTNSSGLRVREHPRLGPYVQGLTRHTVSTLGSLMSYVEEGTKARKTASTSQNPTSSRSHALLTVSLTSRSENSSNTGTTSNGLEKKQHVGGGLRGARLHLVDLAGSERAGNSNYGLHRLKEGANINKSLVALGNVISALAERGATGSGPGKRFIPYRDSALTWLLKDALGGNATTIMLATISPASGSYNETAHTLRFAQRAQSVVNRPVVNEDPVARVIRELRAEISRLTLLLAEKGTNAEENSPCCCSKGHQEAEEFSTHVENVDQEDSPVLPNSEVLDRNKFAVVENIPSFLRGSFSSVSNLHRRCNSEESLSSTRLVEENELAPSPRRSGSLRSLDSSLEGTGNYPKDYNRAKVSSVSYDRVNTLALVDIPTLVAVLIKPDENLPSGSVQIEEISGENILEVSVDNEIAENDEPVELCGLESSAKSETLHSAKVVEPVYDQNKEEKSELEESLVSLVEGSEERLVVEEDRIDSIEDKKLSSNLKSTKRRAFGSSESFESVKRNDRNTLVQRSYTTLQPEIRNRQLNGVNPAAGKAKRTWSPRGSTWASPRKVDSGEKDPLKKIIPDIERSQESRQSKTRHPLRKQDSDSPKRKISREYSKEETVATGPTSKQVRKGSVTSDTLSRTQTPIQRTNRRAEIVAAVTERLYSTKKPSEETPGNSPASEFRSPESTEVKIANTTRMKLQEISRKMLAKRRKTCVDTQTDVASTVRVKDTASITESTEIETKDAGIMTELHENCCNEIVAQDSQGISVTRVKEIATLTERFARTVRCKDVGILTEDYESDGMEEMCKNSFQSREEKRPRNFVETSTNTIHGSSQQNRSFSIASQTLKEDVLADCEEVKKGCNGCHNVHECSYQVPVTNADRNVICITLPDMLSITIESPNTLESKIAVSEATSASSSDEKIVSKLKDGETQTENGEKLKTTEENSSKLNYIMLKDLSTTVTTRSAACQSDGKTFRIENIFKDPKSTEKTIDRTNVSDLLPDLTEHVLLPKSSLKLTNSVGTSFTPETTERSTEIEGLNFVDRKINGQLKHLTDLESCNPTLKRSCRTTETSGQGSAYSQIPFSPLPVSWPTQSPVEMKNVGLKFQTQPILREASSSIPQRTVVKIESQELKSPLLVARLISNSSIDIDSSFSDDSLDPDELCPKLENKSSSLRLDDSLCPPDVVAHTKKDAVYESRVEEDFADEIVEFPRSSVSSDPHTSRVHDYESLVMGRKSFVPIFQDSGESSRMETPESEEGRNQSKKKVSFSNSKQLDRPRTNDARKPKPIIKNKLNTFAGIDSGAVFLEDHHVNEKSGDLRSEDCAKGGKLKASTPLDRSTSENSFRDDISSISGSSETTRSGILYNSDEDSDAQLRERRKREDSEMKRVRFTTLLFNGERGESCTSDSEGCENGVNSDDDDDDDDDEVNYCCEIKGCDSPHKIFASYLNEATAFVHNMNTMNDYVNASRLFLEEQKDPQEEDYIEYKGCRISLKDDTDEYLKSEDLTVPLDSYKNCLRGIAKLENCIERAVSHDKFLLEKYGICLESATTSYSLVDSGKDSAVHVHKENYTGAEFADPGKNSGDLSSNDEENRPKEDRGDVETAIFEHLMDSANSRRRIISAKPYFRRSTRMSDLSGKNPAPYSRPKKKYWDTSNHADQVEHFENLKWYVGGSLQSLPEVIKEMDIKIPQCFLAVPESGNHSSFGKEYRNDIGSSSSEAAVGTSSESIDTVASVRNKFRYPGSPRAKLLQLVSERRQIVNRSRNGSPL